MKKILTIFIFLLIIIVGNVYAADPTDYYVFIDSNDNVTVKKDSKTGPTVADYSSLFTFSNGVLTIKENQSIKYIGYEKDLTITSNDKPVKIDNIYSSDTGGNPISTTLTLSHLNTTTSEYQLSTDYPEKVIIKDSHIGTHRISNRHYDDINDGIYIYDSELIDKIEYSEIHPYSGDLEVKNSKIKTRYINNESKSIYVDNSNIQITNGLYTEEDACIKINNSTITSTYEYSYIDVQLGPEHSEGLFINNSTIDVGRINFSGYRAVGGKLEIKKSNIKCRELMSSRDLYIYDSFVQTNRIQADLVDDTETVIDNSTVNVGNDYINTRIFKVNNSSLTAKCRINAYQDTIIKDSYFNLTAPTEDVTFTNFKDLTISNSNFYVETAVIPVRVFGTFKKDNDVDSLDKVDTKLKLITNPDATEHKVFVYDNNSFSKSVKLVSLATVTFKVENGTWEDGTTDDKTVQVPVWTALKENAIPKVKKGSKWTPTVKVGTIIKKDTTFVNGVEIVPKVDENPNTGVYNYVLEFTIVAAISAIVYLVFKSKKKFKNM